MSKKKKSPIKKWAELYRNFSKEEMPTGTWKDAKHCYSSGKCKLKSQWDIILHLSEWLSSKRIQITNVEEDVEKRGPLYTVGENVTWCSHWKTVGSFLKKTKNLTTMWPSNSTPGYLSKKKNSNH